MFMDLGQMANVEMMKKLIKFCRLFFICLAIIGVSAYVFTYWTNQGPIWTEETLDRNEVIEYHKFYDYHQNYDIQSHEGVATVQDGLTATLPMDAVKAKSKEAKRTEFPGALDEDIRSDASKFHNTTTKRQARRNKAKGIRQWWKNLNKSVEPPKGKLGIHGTSKIFKVNSPLQSLEDYYSIVNHTSEKDPPAEEDSPYDVTIIVPSINSTLISNLLKSAAPFINRPPDHINVINKLWQKVLDPLHEFYLFSAYFDDRPTLEHPMVRVISVLETTTPQLLCVMWYNHNRTAMLSVADKMKIGVRYPHHGKKFDPSILSCQIPSNTKPPDSISIVPAAFPLPTTLLKVQIPEKVEEPLDFGICVSVSYWQHDPYRVIEWMELQKLWGVSEVTIYNDNITTDSIKVFQHYVNQGYVDLQEITNIFNDNSEISYWINMSPSINDCMYRNMYRYKKVICIDIDELIVPRLDVTYKEMLQRYDAEKPRIHPYKSYMFRNVYFFLDLGVVQNVTHLLTQSYLQRVHPSPFGYSVKSMTDPMICEGLQNHVCWHVVPRFKYYGWLVEVTPKIAMNQHYKYCHLDNLPDAYPNACAEAMANQTTDTTMLRFGPVLQNNAKKAWTELSLL